MNQNAKAKRGFPYVALILIVTLVLVVAIIGYSIVDSIGLIQHFNTAAKSNNIKINENHVDVYRYHVAQSQYMTEFMYYQYGLMSDTYGVVKTYGNSATYANAAIYSAVKMDKMHAFDESAYNYAEQYLTYCEGAKEAGKYDTIKAEIAADIDEYIKGLEETAKVNDVSLSKYLKQWMGNGVSEKDVRTAMEYYYIGIEYAESLHEEKGATLKDDDLIKYRDDNKSTYYTSKYATYKLVNNDMKEAMEACKTVEDVKTAIVDYYVNQKFESLYETNFTKANVTDTAGKDKTRADVRATLLALNSIGDVKPVFTASQTTDYEKAAYKIVNNLSSLVKTEVAKVTEGTSANYADPTESSATDLQKWLFAAGRAVGDYKVIESTSTSTNSTTGEQTTTITNTWYCVEKTMVLDEELTKNAYYIKLTDDAEGTEAGLTAAQKGDAMYTALTATKTPEKFAELVEKYASGSSAEMYEKISFETIKSTNEDLANWLYADGRKEGDITKILVKGDSTDTEKVTACYIAYFVDENEMTWKYDCRDARASELVQEWYDAAVVKYNVTIDFEPETEAATTVATTTAAATTTGATATTEPETKAETKPETKAETNADTAA